MENYITLEYPVELTPDDNGTLLVTSPDFPEFTTFGENERSALENSIGAFVALLSEYIEQRRDIPSPSDVKGSPAVSLPPLIAGKVALYWAMQEEKITQIELAKRLDCDPRQVRRLLDPVNSSRQEHLDEALHVLGKKLIVSVASAAE